MSKKFGKAFKKVKKINNQIKRSTKEKNLKYLIFKFSDIFNIPKIVIEDEVKQIISRNYDYKKNKILKIDSFKNFLKNFFLTLGISILILITFFFKKKISKKKKFQIIIDGALKQSEAFHFNEIIKHFEKVCFISKKKYLKNKNIYYFNHKNFFITNSTYSLFVRLKFFYFVFLVLITSIICLKNFYFIFFEVIYKLLKYNFIFNSVISKSYIQSKFYDTSAIKNYIFKVNGGKITSCTQKNLLEVGLSSFIYTDVFFSIGKNTGNLLRELDGKCKKIFPVGSLYMEADWFKKRKDLKKIEKIDVLIVGINTVLRHYKLHITEAFDKNYYKFINWAAIFSKKFPYMKIIIKHHGNFPHDPKEYEIVKNSNIKIHVTNKSINGSYAYAFKSKVLCSFGSTMIFELLGHNIPGFYVDPNYENQQFFELLPQSRKWRLNTYKNFEKEMLARINGKKFKIKNKETYCLNSNNVSKRISNFLKKY